MNIEWVKASLESFRMEGAFITYIDYSADPSFELYDGLSMQTYDYAWFQNAGIKPFYRVALTMKAAPGSEFHAEVWLPEENWNEKVLMLGNGGSATMLDRQQQIGAILEPYAVLHCDLAPTDLSIGVSVPAVWADFGWRATHLTTVAGKVITELVYRKSIQFSYFIGASTGGQQAIAMAEKFPKDYDGILAVCPGMQRTYLHMYFMWNKQNFFHADGTPAFTNDEIQKISIAALEFHQKNGDGAPGDTFISNPRLIQGKLQKLLEKIQTLGLSADQMMRLEKIYQGPINPRTGEKIFAGLPVGSEVDFFQCFATMDAYDEGFLYPISWGIGTPLNEWDRWTFDFDEDVEKVRRLDVDCNADSADLSQFKVCGGKLLMWMGTEDPIVPAASIIEYYERVIEKQKSLEATKDFFRFFLLPGYGHCGRASNGMDCAIPAEGMPTVFDLPGRGLRAQVQSCLHALTKWVEQNEAPNWLIGIKFKDASEISATLCADKEIELERPLYAYPDEAEYIGGDRRLLTSFCRRQGSLGHDATRAERYWPK